MAEEESKALQEMAKLGSKALETGDKLGSFLSRVFGTLPADVIGVVGGDWLHHVRIRNAARLTHRTEEILRERGILEQTEPMSPSVALPLLHAAQDETRDELAEMWARMLANGMDPNRSRSVRQSIIATVASLEPTDAIILQKAFEKVPEAGTQAVFEDLRSTLSVSADELKLSIENLSKLGCITDTSGRQEDGIIIIYGLSLSSLGREVVRACSL
jgi:hypothetical protein